MREAAVTAALHGARQQLLREAPAAAAAAGGQQPGSPPALGATLLALLAQQPDHGGATLSMTYRFHQLLPPGPSRTGLPHTHQLQPLPCAILNLHTTGSRAAEGAGSQGAYDSFRPAMRLPAIPALSPCAQPGSAGGLLHHLARSAAEAGTALEGYLQAVLQQMAQLGRQVCSGDAALQSLRQDNAALLARVAERHAAASWSNKRQQGEDEQAAAVASKPASGTTALPQPSTQQQQAAVVHASLPPTQQPNANQNILPDLI